jgi:iron complex transport system ATP-binding protein
MVKPILAICDVGIDRDGVSILRNCSLEVRPDQTWAILGPNGAGKSFFLRVLSGDLVPSSGTVEILGRLVGASDLRETRKLIGMISSRMEHQFPAKITTFDVVLSGFSASFGIPSFMNKYKVVQQEFSAHETEYALSLVQQFGLRGKEQRTFGSLSDGEKKRALIARALVHSPKLLVFDEPCQGLDIGARIQLLNVLEELSDKLPSIFVVHHLEELPQAVTHVALMKCGTILSYGKKNEILTSEKLSELFDTLVTPVNFGNTTVMVPSLV